LACAAASLREPSIADVQVLQARGEPATLSDLQEGKFILEHSCSRCHSSPDAGDGADSDWPNLLSRMSTKAGLDSVSTWRVKVYMASLQQK